VEDSDGGSGSGRLADRRPAAVRAGAPLTGLRVLVVDDHADTLTFLQQALGYAGAAVVTASCARAALAALDSIDVVVTDYAMPDEDGLWLLERVREQAAAVPVLALTGFAESQKRALAHAPFARVLLKPIDPWRLCEEIRAVVRPR
jgi:CheY-like chemotaxis protein